MKKLLLLMVVFLCAGMVIAGTTTWTDADPGNNFWGTAGNWDTGVLPTAADWAKVRNGPPGALITSETDAVVERCHIGYEDGSALTIDGGTLFMSNNDVLIGKNGGSATLYMISGRIDCKDLEVGDEGDSGFFTMIGGHVELGDDLMIPEDPNSTAEVHLDGGTIYVEGELTMRADAEGTMNGSMDITFGEMTIDHDVTPTVQGWVDDGWITGFGVVGNVTLEVVNNDTVVTAGPDPMERSPGHDAEVNTADDPGVDLSWVNLDPVAPAEVVWVDVWFGTDFTRVFDPCDPDKVEYVDFTKVVDANSLAVVPPVISGMDTTSVTVLAPGTLQEYFWRVDTYYDDPAGTGAEPNVIGVTIPFTVSDDFPPTIVMSTPRTVTWANEPFLVEATVYDEGTSEVTVTWDTSINSDPNEEYSNQGIVLPTGTTYPYVVSTYLTVDFAQNSFGMRANAADAVGDNWSDSVNHQCRADACDAAMFWWARDGGGVPQGDVNDDCSVDLNDLLVLAVKWLDDYAPLVPTEMPQ